MLNCAGQSAALSSIFVVGYASAAIFGTIIGGVADRFGRKRACITCGIVFLCSSLSVCLTSVPSLFLGRYVGHRHVHYVHWVHWMVAASDLNMSFSLYHTDLPLEFWAASEAHLSRPSSRPGSTALTATRSAPTRLRKPNSPRARTPLPTAKTISAPRRRKPACGSTWRPQRLRPTSGRRQMRKACRSSSRS